MAFRHLTPSPLQFPVAQSGEEGQDFSKGTLAKTELNGTEAKEGDGIKLGSLTLPVLQRP